MKSFHRRLRAPVGVVLSLLGLVLPMLVTPLLAQRVQHPLDPLNYEEYWAVLEILRDDGKLDEETRFSMINLKPPPKDEVWGFSKGKEFSRRAFALVRQKEKTYEAEIDLAAEELTSWSELTKAHANWLGEEHEALKKEIKKHPDFIAALKKRGIEDLTFIDCGVGPPGYYGTDEQRGRRVGHATCHRAGNRRNQWTSRIEGVTVVLDMNEKKVLRVVDEGVVPIPDTRADYDPASIGPPREVPGPLRIEQPLGPGFTINGNIVEWQNWRFHVRHDQRVGIIVSTVTYRDDDDKRPVLYEGYLSEMFVPYMDPAFNWYNRNFLDLGEFTAGGIAKPLLRDLDCPDNAVYLDGLVAQDNGRPQTRRDIICLFERDPGAMAWRHALSPEPESRRQRDLVVRAAAVVGNYDYIFDWVFLQNGSIRVRVGASGEAEAKIVKEATADAPREELSDAGETHAGDGNGNGGGPAPHAPDAYGRFVDKHIVAVNHDHYFNFRIDLDVDGPHNRFIADRLVTKTLPADHPRRSIWVRDPRVLKKESEGKLDIDLRKPTLWRVTSSGRKNHVGYPTSYQLRPGRTSTTLMTADDYPRRRAGFIDHHLWVTPYRKDERYAAGDYPTLSEPGKGLPAWTAADRELGETDLVLWHSITMQHMVRAEDWPVMPTLWHSFELRPFDFFDGNPALDLPRQ